MNIGEVSQHTGLPPKTIRYYEDIGLVKPLRDANGYRAFRESEMHKLAFLCRARTLGRKDPCRKKKRDNYNHQTHWLQRPGLHRVASLKKRITSSYSYLGEP